MTEWLGRLVDITWVDPLMESWWIYPILFGFSALDAFFPVVPSESLVITVAVFAAATGSPNAVVVAVCAAAGAFLGDNISRLIGRGLGARFFVNPGPKRLAARRLLHRRGGLIIVVARYVPGGRTAITMTAGAVGYPLPRFLFFAAIAAVSWGIYGTLLGYAGGSVFEDDPLLGVVVGIGFALTITAVVEVTRYLHHRRRVTRVAETTASPPPEPVTASEIEP